ncbi:MULTISPECIES: acyl carrier protein [unclassified Corynebacterium]|uniref:acyl carrier protein n=1 Tax=unclassified Corynebacterium TaxID=2624378 RepID=UPI0030A7F9B0
MTRSLSEALGALLSDDATTTSSKKKGGASGASASDQPKDRKAAVRGDVTEILRRVSGGFGDESADGEDAPPPALDAPLASFGLDRLGVIELAVRCEEEIGVRVEDDDIAGFTTLGDVVTYLTDRIED